MTRRERNLLAVLGITVLLGGAGLWYLNKPSGKVESFTTFADDLPRVNEGDVNKHFRSVWGRNPTIEEWRYWFQRTKDTPVLVAYLDAMKYYRARGESPRVDDSDFVPNTSPIRMKISTAKRYLFEGDRINIKVELTNEAPIKNRGFVETTVNTTQVRQAEAIPVAGKVTALPGGSLRLRHGYDLEPDETMTITVPITVPSPNTPAIRNVASYSKPVLHVEARVRDLSARVTETFRVVEAITENQSGMTYAQRQVPIIFLHVYDRLPTSEEKSYWRSQLPRVNNKLGALKGAMEVARGRGSTGDVDSVISVDDINRVFRSVYGRDPTQSEWQYWVGRLSDKPTERAMQATMQYHKQAGIRH